MHHTMHCHHAKLLTLEWWLGQQPCTIPIEQKSIFRTISQSKPLKPFCRSLYTVIFLNPKQFSRTSTHGARRCIKINFSAICWPISELLAQIDSRGFKLIVRICLTCVTISERQEEGMKYKRWLSGYFFSGHGARRCIKVNLSAICWPISELLAQIES
jgi:hypothetical protein